MFDHGRWSAWQNTMLPEKFVVTLNQNFVLVTKLRGSQTPCGSLTEIPRQSKGEQLPPSCTNNPDTRVLRRDHRKCQNYSKLKLEVHYKEFRSQGGDDSEEPDHSALPRGAGVLFLQQIGKLNLPKTASKVQ